MSGRIVLPAPATSSASAATVSVGPSLMKVVWAGLIVLMALVFAPAESSAQLIAGANANVVGGPTCTQATDANCPFQVFGDVSIQRQNEGSMACSSRNPLTCLAAGNDYRLINVPGVADGKVTADAWLGLYWTRNGGQDWRSTLLPGWKTDNANFHDNTPQGAVGGNPIAGFEAAADPTVRAGTHGLLYLSGIAFNRAEENNGASNTPLAGGEGKSGVQFASVFIDDNNSTNPNSPPRYLRTSIVDSGTSGRFLDKPWIIADIPRIGATANCTIPAGPGGNPAAQSIQTGYVYIAYATFLGSGNNAHSDIWVRSSSDCGATWSAGTKVTQSVPLNQSPIVVVSPATGNLAIVWREFGQNGTADRILTASSTNSGKTFGKVTELANLGVPTIPSYWPSPVSTAFDQTTLPNVNVNNLRMARTNGYPSACFATDGSLRVAFSKRISQGANAVVPGINFARIMMGTMKDGVWTRVPAPIDNHPGPGHQFQPSIACTGNSATAIWYDQRYDLGFVQQVPPTGVAWVMFPFVIDPIPTPPTHTIDVRASRTDDTGSFANSASVQVSRYPLAYDTATTQFVQLQYNFLDFPLFGGGIVPFIGDYLEVVPKNPFTPPLCANAACTAMTPWSFNTFSNESPLAHGLWTDNRDIMQLSLQSADIHTLDWTNYGAPNTAACDPTRLTRSWTRNQNLYTSILGAGFVMQAEGNARRTKDLEKRAYVVQMQNLVPPVAGQNNTLKKRFRLTFAANSGEASFNFAADFTSLTAAQFQSTYGRAAIPVQDTLYVDIDYASGAAKSVFVRKNSTAPVVIIGEEVTAFTTGGSLIPLANCSTAGACPLVTNGLKSRVIVAPDPSAPVQTLTSEEHDADFILLPVNTGAGVVNSVTYSYPSISSGVVLGDPNFSNNLLNPTWTSPTWTSPTWTSPTWTSPTWTSPTWTSPTWTSPTWTSPTWTSPTWTSPTWTSPTWTSTAITETSYLATGTGTVTSGYELDALIQSLPQGAIMQTLVSKVISVPGTDTCDLGTQIILQPVANVSSVNGATNSSFSLAPGEQAIVTVRVACDAANATCYNPMVNTSVVLTKQSPDCTTSPELVNPDLPRCELPSPANRYDIIDSAPPIIAFSPAAPNNVVQGSNPQGAIVPYSASASDGVDAILGVGVDVECRINGVVVDDSSSTRLFPYGTTTVICTSRDSHNNLAANTFTIEVIDTVAPVVTVPSNVTIEATSAPGAAFTFSASAMDAVDGPLTPTCAPASGSTFALGATTVTCSATDAFSNVGSASFVVTVRDTTAPVVTAPVNAVLQAVSAAGAPHVFTASASDVVSGSLVPVCVPASGSTFPLGQTTVRCSATDGASNTGSATFTVTVVDTMAPAVSVPANATREATSSSGAVHTFTASASDLVSGVLTPVCLPASGSTFPLGTTTVTCSATDAANNTGSNSFTVTVVDTTAPAVAVPANATVQATSAAGAAYSFTATASDAVGGSLTPTCSPASGATFALGQTTVTCSVTDAASNTGSASFSVTVVDTIAPAVSTPANQTLQATSPAGAAYSFTATAADAVSGALTPGCSPVSGTTFPMGATTVNCSVTDGAGNTGAASFVVTVVDTIAPVLMMPGNVVTLSTPGGTTASVTYSVSATDLGQAAAVSCSSTAGTVSAFPATQLFAIGVTTVTCSANDTRGNTSSASFTVTVAAMFGIVGPLSPYQVPPKTYNGGSSVPIAWQYSIAGSVVPSPFPQWTPNVRFVKVLNWGTRCAAGGTESQAPADTFINTDTPGNSFFSYAASTSTWKLNWNSPMQPNTCWNIYIGTADRPGTIPVGRLQLK